jgi:hypothetical protein
MFEVRSIESSLKLCQFVNRSILIKIVSVCIFKNDDFCMSGVGFYDFEFGNDCQCVGLKISSLLSDFVRWAEISNRLRSYA